MLGQGLTNSSEHSQDDLGMRSICVKNGREEGVAILTGSVKVLEAIINDADPTTRCARASKTGPPGEGN